VTSADTDTGAAPGDGTPAGRRTAIVTGAASGIGLAIAERLAADGLAVAVLDLDGEAADAAAAKIVAAGGTAIGVRADVTDRATVDAAVEQVRAELGAATVLVNNAGLDGFQPFLKIKAETWNRIIEVNLTGTFQCCQAVVPDMLAARWGRIVNISSSSAQGGQPLMTHYVASKAGVIGFTKALALELGPKGITVNTIPPGFIDTPMLRRSESKGLLGDSVDHHASLTPVRRVGRPEDIAAACSFLVSDDASYVTGQVIGVNGGRNT
jgi:NAD(P)-dependent dehydrogenase (short-subunit alcohol dehydrogenase family)